jgi:hypothetical protein
MVTIANTASTRYKPSFAPSVNVGLCVWANGEEGVRVIDRFGFVTTAGIFSPVDKPTLSAGGVGSMVAGQFVCYVYVYAAARRYPYVEAMAMGGNIYPRGNPSPPSDPIQIPAGGAVQVEYHNPSSLLRPDLDRVWIFRTLDADTAKQARRNARAGDFYFVDSIPVPPNDVGTVSTFTDTFETPTDDLVEYDNFSAPQFNFALFVDPYWWGFGNFELPVKAHWDEHGTVTFDDPDFTFYSGRYMQSCYLKTVADTTDVQRNYYAQPIVAQPRLCRLAINLDGVVPAQFDPGAGEGWLVFNGPSTTLYRSKFRNPLAWGDTTYVGAIRVPDQFYLKVGGGIGTGIAQVPNIPLLVVSTKAPAATYTLDLRTAGTDQFASSKRLISSLYSTSSHFSQFAASTDTGNMVLWSHDADNFCILACDGNAIVPVSAAVSQTMRRLTRDRDLRRLVHGIYDPNTQMNCMWLAREGATDSMDVLVAQHAPTGNWHINFEGDVLSSAILESIFCSLRHLYVGTEQGMFGTGMDEQKTRNWIPEDVALSGLITDGNNVPGIDKNLAGVPCVVGNWMLVVNQNTGLEQIGRIIGVTTTHITVDKLYVKGQGWNNDWTQIPLVGNRFYIGLNETVIMRYFDLEAFIEDKKLEELWITQQNAQTPPVMQYYRDRTGQQLVLPDGTVDLQLQQVKYDDGETPSEQWETTTPPTERTKVFGIRIVERGYQFWKLFGWGGKYR